MDKQWLRGSIFCLVFFMVFRIVPSFFEGPFIFSLGTVNYIFIMLGVLLLTWFAYKFFVSKWGVEWKIMHHKPPQAITFIIIYLLFALAVLSFGATITQEHPIKIFATFSPMASFGIGIAIVLIFVMISLLLKSKVIALLSILLAAPSAITFLIFGYHSSKGADLTQLSLILIGIIIVISLIKKRRQHRTQTK